MFIPFLGWGMLKWIRVFMSRQITGLEIEANAEAWIKKGDGTVTEIEGRDRAEVLAEVENLNSNEIQSYILDHKRGFYNQFTRNIPENVTGESEYLDLGKATRSPKAGSYMHSMNELSYYIRWFGLLAILWSLIISFRAKNFSAVFQIVLLSSLTYYYILTTGLSFWQGDRLVLPIIAIWSTLYVAMIASLIRKIQLKSTTT